MKNANKIVCSIISVIMCITSICFPIAATAETEKTTATVECTQNDQILFSYLFFNQKDDIDKITTYFDSEITDGTIPQMENINIEYLITSLGLNTNYEETACIIKNVIYIDEYVEEEKIKEATTGSSLSDPLGGMLSKLPEAEPSLEPGIQPLWSKDSVHRDKTTELAKSYFSSSIATKIGDANREVDIKYSSGKGAINNSPNQYIHFNQYASGSEDSRDYAAATWFIACELAWNKGQKDNAYMYLGYALHPLQDKESHGQIGRGKSTPQHIVSYTAGDNIVFADAEKGWEWKNSSKNSLKYVSGSTKRYNAAVSVTRTYLSKYKNILK